MWLTLLATFEKKNRESLQDFLKEMFFALIFSKGRDRTQMHLWWKHATEDKVPFGKRSCSW